MQCLHECQKHVGRVLALIALLPASVSAQEISNSFEELRSSEQIEEGDAIRIIELSGTTIEGRLVSISTDSLSLITDQAQQDISEASVREIRRKPDSLGNGMGIGAMLGLALGGAMAGAASYSDGESGAYGVAIGLPIMAGAGLGVGALMDYMIKNDDTVFRAPNASSRQGLTIEPIVSTTQTAAKISISF